MGAAAPAVGAVGAIARHLSGPGVRAQPSRSAWPHGADAVVYAGGCAHRNRLAAARRPVDLQRAVRLACLPVGRPAGVGAPDVPRLPQPRLAAILLARGTAAARGDGGPLRRRYAAQLGQRRVRPVPAAHAGAGGWGGVATGGGPRRYGTCRSAALPPEADADALRAPESGAHAGGRRVAAQVRARTRAGAAHGAATGHARGPEVRPSEGRAVQG